MNEREHAVLSLFYEEGHEEITPSLLAYRMRMSTDDATKLLDGMVKKDLLNLHVDDEGHISYQLTPSERHRIASRPKQSDPYDQQPPPRNEARDSGEPSAFYPASAPGDGTDAYAGQPHQPRPPHQSAQHAPSGQPGRPQGQSRQHYRDATTSRSRSTDGTDGSVGPGSPVTGSVSHDEPPPGHSGWYQDDPQPRQHHAPPPRQRSPQHMPPTGGGQPRRRDTRQRNPSAEQFQQQLQRELYENPRNLPARSQEQHPSQQHIGPRRERIPILAGALSLLIPGLGQFYNGEISKGVMLLFSYVFLIMFWLFWIVHIWSIIDAYMVAEQSNQRALTDDNDPPQRPLLTEHPHHNSNPNSTAA